MSTDLKTKQVIAVFDNVQSANMAADRLIEAGVTQDQVSVLLDDKQYGKHVGMSAQTKAPEGAATGGLVGGVIGAIALGASAVGTIVVPGVGTLFGPLIAAVAGAGAGAAAGGVVGGLVGLGIPEHEAKAYQQTIKEGGVLLGVEAEKHDAHEIRRILRDSGGHGLSTN